MKNNNDIKKTQIDEEKLLTACRACIHEINDLSRFVLVDYRYSLQNAIIKAYSQTCNYFNFIDCGDDIGFLSDDEFNAEKVCLKLKADCGFLTGNVSSFSWDIKFIDDRFIELCFKADVELELEQLLNFLLHVKEYLVRLSHQEKNKHHD